MALWLDLYQPVFMTWRHQVTKKAKFWNCSINISINSSARSSIKSSKCRKCSWLSYCYIQLPILLSVKKKIVGTSKWRPFWILKYQTQLQFYLRYEKSVPHYSKKSSFHGDDVIGGVTGWPESCRLYSCLGEVGSGSKLQGQDLVNKCEYRNRRSRLYMPKEDLNE